MTKKKLIVLLFVSVVTFAGINSFIANNQGLEMEVVEKNEKYKECIRACNETIIACNNCIKACSNTNDPKLMKCIQYCKENIVVCKSSIQLMQLNSSCVKEMCNLCAKMCEICAKECDMKDMKAAKDCSAACLKSAKMCKEIQM